MAGWEELEQELDFTAMFDAGRVSLRTRPRFDETELAYAPIPRHPCSPPLPPPTYVPSLAPLILTAPPLLQGRGQLLDPHLGA